MPIQTLHPIQRVLVENVQQGLQSYCDLPYGTADRSTLWASDKARIEITHAAANLTYAV